MPESAGVSVDEEELLSFFYMCPVGVLRTTADGTVQMINPEAAQLLMPLTRKPVLQNLFDALESCAPELRGMAARFSAASGSICEQYRIFVSSSGPGPRVVACSLVKINASCLMAVLQDVTKQVEQERQIRQSEAMFAALMAGVRDFALFSLDENGKIDSWNKSAERQTGLTPAEVIGHDLGVLSLPGHARADNVAEQVAEAVREGWSLRDRWCVRRDDERYWCQIMVAADSERGSQGKGSQAGITELGSAVDHHAPIAGFAVVLRDVTERHVTGEQLHRLLTTDYLTGAVNRGRFFEIAEIELARHRQLGPPVAALMLDLDHFKLVNDCFGHAAGDVVLQRLVEVCRAQLRGRDVLARMGGEEFAVLLPDTALPDALLIAERICHSVPKDIMLPVGNCLGGTPWQAGPIGVSIGCAALNASVVGIDALLKAADAALYAAKRAGRGQVRAASQDIPAARPG
jgi:diguanylate cyclase (GGDEF)-like protein/PAS domain S-box-containing protein